MIRKITRFFIGLFLWCIVALLIAFNGLLLWVEAGPRSLDKLTPYIEQALQHPDGNYTVKIEQTWLIWDGWRHPLNMRLRNVSVITREGETFSEFPEIALGIDLFYLPFGRIFPTSIAIDHPVISLLHNEDRSISFGFKSTPSEDNAEAPQKSHSIPLAAVLAPFIDSEGSGNLRRLRSIRIMNAEVSVGNAKSGIVFEANETNFEIRRSRSGEVKASGNTHLRYDEYRPNISGDFRWKRSEGMIEGVVAFSGLMPSKLVNLFMEGNEDIPEIDVPLTGTLGITLDSHGQFERIGYYIEGGRGTINSRFLHEPLQISTFTTEGKISNKLHDIQIDSLLANMGPHILTAKGNITLADNDMAIRGNIGLKQVDAKDVDKFWPPAKSPVSREWVITNITNGKVTQATANVNIQMGDIAKPALPKEAIDATIELEGANVRYLPEHPEAKNVKAKVHVDGESLTTEILSASYLQSTTISGGTVEIADLNADNPHIVVDVAVQTTAKDAVAFLRLPRLGQADRLNLNEKTAEGKIQLTGKVGFDFYAPHDAQGKPIGEPEIDYDITAKLDSVSQPGFMKKFDIANANGTLSVNNRELLYKGTSQVNGVDVNDGTVKYLFTPEDGFDTFITVSAKAPVTSLPRFGYPNLDFLQGTLGVKGDMKQGPAKELYTGTLDLTNTILTAEKIGLDKPDKEPATLDIIVDKRKDDAIIKKFTIKGKDADMSGSGSFNKDMTDIQSITVGKSRWGKTNLDKASYENTNGSYKVSAQGDSADIGFLVEDDPQKQSTFSLAKFPAIDLDVALDHVLLGKAGELRQVKGTLNCSTKLCNSANITGNAGDKPFSLRILRNPKGQRQFSLSADNAGAFIKAAGVFEGMSGGTLSISGNYDDTVQTDKATSKLHAKLIINDFTLTNAPVLAKILSLASFTGLIDSLQGKGVRFEKMTAPFTLQNDVFTFRKVKVRGPSIGLTAEGTIALPHVDMAIQGTVVPAYTLNSMVGKVPIVGNVLTGGDGQGVFAASYNVKGTYKEPDVSVNPLSILAPGFLRRLFESSDNDEE
ncbi:MAG: AsmA-like C-terminal domain-containing protein [Rickettsiales bacterium]|nr:AsmA-like C-terminal domain-containing protein [Rickettsiales bacterium]